MKRSCVNEFFHRVIRGRYSGAEAQDMTPGKRHEMGDRFRAQLRHRLKDRGVLFFTLLILIHLVPIWSFTYFPSQDGPAHINNANILREYYQPDRSIFREYYSLNKNFE